MTYESINRRFAETRREKVSRILFGWKDCVLRKRLESEIAKLKFSPSNLDITSRLRLFLPSRVRPIPCNAIYDVLTLIFFSNSFCVRRKKKEVFTL